MGGGRMSARRAVAADLPLTPAHLLVAEIAARPGIALQLGTAAYQQLLAVVMEPDSTVVNSFWIDKFQAVLRMLRSELPQFEGVILDAAAAVQRSAYTGPRVTNRYVACPRGCGDVAAISGRFSAECMSCGTVTPRRQR
jgi:hypothetical protein